MIDIYELLRRNQDGTSDYVKAKLEELNIIYSVDEYGNIFCLDNENSPLLSAHMDTVRKEEDFCIGAFLTESENDRIFSGGILGGDDKCGVYIILKVLESGRKVNFIFSRDEETGCKGIKALVKTNSYAEKKDITDKIKDCLWCLVLDRRSNSDIICEKNNYGTKKFEEALEKISDEGSFGYKSATGLCSDADTIRDYISTANISVGYYSPHSQKEYILKSDLEKAYNYTLAVIDNLKEKFEPAEYRPKYSYSNNNYYNNSRYYYDDYYSHYYYDGYYDNSKNSKDDYPGYDDDEMDYSDFSWQDWKNLKNTGSNKTGEICKCSFCNTSPLDDTLYTIMLPDATERKICEYCLEDLEDEIEKIRLLNFR